MENIQVRTGRVASRLRKKLGKFQYVTPSFIGVLWYMLVAGVGLAFVFQTLLHVVMCLALMSSDLPMKDSGGAFMWLAGTYVCVIVFDLLVLLVGRVVLETCHVQFDISDSLRSLVKSGIKRSDLPLPIVVTAQRQQG